MKTPGGWIAPARRALIHSGCSRGSAIYWITPSTMAPTKAMAAYAVTTLTLPIKGPSKVIAKSPSFMSLPAQLPKLAKRSRRKKSALLHYYRLSTGWIGGNMVKEV